MQTQTKEMWKLQSEARPARFCLRLHVVVKKLDRGGSSKTNCRVSVTSRKPGGPRARAHFRVDEARALAQMEEPSHCRRPATATQGIRSSAEHQRPSRNQCHWRITRTSTNQFPVSWNSVGVVEGVEVVKRGGYSYMMVHMTWWVTCGMRRIRTVQLLMDWVVCVGVGDDEALPFISDLSAPSNTHQQSLVEKKKKKKLYFALNVFSPLTCMTFKNSIFSIEPEMNWLNAWRPPFFSKSQIMAENKKIKNKKQQTHMLKQSLSYLWAQNWSGPPTLWPPEGCWQWTGGTESQ